MMQQKASVPERDDDAAAEPDALEPERRAWQIDVEAHGQRVDKLLASSLSAFSRSHLQEVIAQGHVTLDGVVVASASRRVKAGQHLQVTLWPTAQALAFRPQAMPLPIVYEDDHLLVLDKPAGLVVHPAAGNWSGTLLNGLLAHHAGAAVLPRAGIVHRLDKDTSGLMVVAKSTPAVTALVRAIAAREVQRIYLALAHGVPTWRELTIDAPIGRDHPHGGGGGRQARAHGRAVPRPRTGRQRPAVHAAQRAYAPDPRAPGRARASAGR